MWKVLSTHVILLHLLTEWVNDFHFRIKNKRTSLLDTGLHWFWPWLWPWPRPWTIQKPLTMAMPMTLFTQIPPRLQDCDIKTVLYACSVCCEEIRKGNFHYFTELVCVICFQDTSSIMIVLVWIVWGNGCIMWETYFSNVNYVKLLLLYPSTLIHLTLVSLQIFLLLPVKRSWRSTTFWLMNNW